MKLHNNKEAFRDAVAAAANHYHVNPAIVEKDYFMTLVLEKLKDDIPGILFKGGTSLSKCHHVIRRFSEDIDLTLDACHFTQANKRNANKAIMAACDALSFAIDNREQAALHGHGNYNCYRICYPAIFSDTGIKPSIQLEMTFIQKAYPDEYKPVCSLIGEFLLSQGQETTVSDYGLMPYEIKVQALERTLIDKVFALCDYYLSDVGSRQSRHIYDIHKLMPVVNWRNQQALISEVRKERKPNKMCLSAQDDVSVTAVLRQIIATAYYKKDYEAVTASLLSEPVNYETAICSLAEIAESRVFDH